MLYRSTVCAKLNCRSCNRWDYSYISFKVEVSNVFAWFLIEQAICVVTYLMFKLIYSNRSVRKPHMYIVEATFYCSLVFNLQRNISQLNSYFQQ